MMDAIPPNVRDQITRALDLKIKAFSFCGGGCINSGGRLSTSRGDYFLKWNDARKFPGMFSAEAKGLGLLKGAGAIFIPHVIIAGEVDAWQFLLLEFVDEARQSPHYWRDLGYQLATLHKNTAATFGLDHDNYIGSLPQRNAQRSSWVDFFIEQRLSVQIQLATDGERMPGTMLRQFESLFKKLPQLLPQGNPALLHGDLWSGNLITGPAGQPCLIDPAVYFGNREAEIAFTQLFGGFAPAFYDHYGEALPLEKGFEDRCDIYNLYPLMVHVNLFGGAYASQVAAILRAFS